MASGSGFYNPLDPSVGVLGDAPPNFGSQIAFENSLGLLEGVSAANPLPVAVTVSGGNPAAGPTGSPVPTDADYIGFQNDSGNLVGVSATNPLPITGSISASNPSVGTTGTTAPTSATEIGFIASSNLVAVSSANPLPVTFSGTVSVSGSVSVSNFPATQPVSGTVTADQGGAPWSVTFPSPQAVSLASTTITGTVAVTQSTSPWVTADEHITADLNQDASGNVGVNIENTPTVEQGAAPWSVTFPSAQAVTLASTTITGTVAVTQSGTWTVQQGSAPWSVTFPSAQAVTLASTTITGTVAVTQSGTWNIGTVTTVTTVSAVTAITDALPAGTNTIGKVDILGNAGATLDATVGAGTAPTNGLAVLSQYNSSAPAPTAAETMIQQADAYGNLFVNNIRRSQVKPVTGSIDSTTAATLLAAQATGIFADLATVVLTVGGAASTESIITVNISDGTNTYEFGIQTGPTSIAGGALANVSAQFDPPIPATNSATAWTIALSAADVTIRYVATFILQKAS